MRQALACSPLVRWGVPLLAAMALGIGTGIAVAAAIHIPQVDSVVSFQPSLITRVFSRDGEPFAQFARERRIRLHENEIPEVLAHAVVAVEDSKFFQHGGVDAEGVLRAAWTNLRAGRVKEGASTLTMQLARALYLTRERSWKRKIEEAFTAVELEKRYSKQQLLTLYCNLFNVGHGNYGMEAGAQYYFNKSVGALEVQEAAMLAGIVQRPSDYSPYRKPKLVLERRNWVLHRMRDVGYLTEAEYQEATAKPLGVVPQKLEEPSAAYFAEEVRQYVESAYGTTRMLEGGLQVSTTLDTAIQNATQDALRAGLAELDKRKGWRGKYLRKLSEAEIDTLELASWDGPKPAPDNWFEGVVLASDASGAQVRIRNEVYTLAPEGLLDEKGRAWTGQRQPNRLLVRGNVAWFRLEPPAQDDPNGQPRLFLEQMPQLEAAALVLESSSGAVRAMVGGWSFQHSKFNRATQAHRQVGSAFKLFVWGPALEAGFTPADTLFDAPTYFLGASGLPDYRPRNYDRIYHGIVTLRWALEKSLNMTAVKLQDMVGVDQTIAFARRCGVQTELQPVPSLALGVADLTPMELAAAFAAVANHGTYAKPYLIERIANSDGQVLETHLPETHQAMEPEIAYLLNHMLQGVVDRGTGFSLHDLPLSLAGKTGTTDDYSDAWFVGFTPRYTILTWVGYDQMRPIGRNMTGAEAAIPTWRRIAERGLAEGWLQPDEPFVRPPGVTLVAVERNTGLLATPAATEVIEEAFLAGTQPVRSYTPMWAGILQLPWYQQRPHYVPKRGERMPEDFEAVARQDTQIDADRP